MIPELSPAALRAPPGYVCPDPRMTLEVKDPELRLGGLREDGVCWSLLGS